MNILVTGVTGYVAQHLCKELVQRGHKIFGVTRNPETGKTRIDFPCSLIKLDEVADLKNIEAVINLAGASVAGGRWTKKYKKELTDSRVGLTKQLINHLDKTNLKVFLSASAIGYYADGGDKELTEESPVHEGFIGELCNEWEKAADSLSCRVVKFRIGVILGHLSSALSKMSSLFKVGLGAPLGNGRQYMSFIHVDDLVGLFLKALENEDYKGTLNAASLEPVQNKEFTKLLAKQLGVMLISPPVPPIALKLLYGEMAQVLLRSHRVVPKKALELGFEFKHQTIKQALQASLKN